jgi:hypothetical protein
VTGAGGLSQTLTVMYVGTGATTYASSTAAPVNVGTYSATATYAESTNHFGSTDTKAFTIDEAAQSAQTITFNALSTKTYGDAGTTVHITSAGSATITAHQSGDASYAAATDVQQTFTISQKPLTPSFTASDKDYDGTATATISGRSLTGGTVGIDVVSLGTSGTAAFADANAGIGKTVTATGFALTGAAADNYSLTATSATTTATINKATATVSLTGLTGQAYTGSALSAGATTTPSGLAVNVTYDGNTQAPTAAGSYAVIGSINDNNYKGYNGIGASRSLYLYGFGSNAGYSECNRCRWLEPGACRFLRRQRERGHGHGQLQLRRERQPLGLLGQR